MRIRVDGGLVRVDAPAKLNLFLEILGKRDDGYHELQTLMATVGLYDTLIFKEESSERVHLRCFSADGHPDQASEEIPSDERNLVVRAANLLRNRAGITQGVAIALFKRIPAAAGLAGGSSDAAATLVALNRIWNLHLPRQELQSLAAELGSDIPFFLAESPLALCTGRGEQVQPLEVAWPCWSVIVRPPVGLSTAAVYREFRPRSSPVSVDSLIHALRQGSPGLTARLLRNALQEPAERLCPQIRGIAQAFAAFPGVPHQMSGSGTAYFGICRSRDHARHLAAKLRGQDLGRVFVAPICP